MTSARRTAPALTVLVLAKSPRPGACKTRLAPRYGVAGAARLAAAALADTLDAMSWIPAQRRVLVLDGDPEPLRSNGIRPQDCGFEVAAQSSGAHGDRIAAAFELAEGAAVLVGMDTPQLTPDDLRVDLSSPVDAWLGLAQDGGWWAMALRHAARDARTVLRGVPMSTDRTGLLQRERLLRNGLSVADLPVLRDVDEPQDALAVARAAPATRFAQTVRLLERQTVPPHEGTTVRPLESTTGR